MKLLRTKRVKNQAVVKHTNCKLCNIDEQNKKLNSNKLSLFKITSRRISYSLDTNVHSFFLRRRLACFILGFVPHNELFSSKKVSIWMCPLKTFKTILENSYLTETISCLHFRCEKITKVLKVPPTVTEVDFLKFLIRIPTDDLSYLSNPLHFKH